MLKFTVGGTQVENCPKAKIRYLLYYQVRQEHQNSQSKNKLRCISLLMGSLKPECAASLKKLRAVINSVELLTSHLWATKWWWQVPVPQFM